MKRPQRDNLQSILPIDEKKDHFKLQKYLLPELPLLFPISIVIFISAWVTCVTQSWWIFHLTNVTSGESTTSSMAMLGTSSILGNLFHNLWRQLRIYGIILQYGHNICVEASHWERAKCNLPDVLEYYIILRFRKWKASWFKHSSPVGVTTDFVVWRYTTVNIQSETRYIGYLCGIEMLLNLVKLKFHQITL